MSAKQRSPESPDSGVRLEQASWIAMILSSLVSASVTVASIVVFGPPVLVAATAIVLSFFLWLVLVVVLVF